MSGSSDTYAVLVRAIHFFSGNAILRATVPAVKNQTTTVAIGREEEDQGRGEE
jgi:hypothetical protein